MKNNAIRRLDIGSGLGDDGDGGLPHVRLTNDFEHMDIRQNSHIEHVWNVENTPYVMFENGTFDVIRAHNILEHLHSETLLRVLTEWKRILKINGVLNIRVPNARELLRAYNAKELSPFIFIKQLASEDAPWGELGKHKTAFDPLFLELLLKDAGFAYMSYNERPEVFEYGYTQSGVRFVFHDDVYGTSVWELEYVAYHVGEKSI